MSLSLVPGSGSATSWAAALRHLFDARTRGRAIEYIDNVELSVGDGSLFVASVPGSRAKPYEVRLVAGITEDGALVACDCPVGDSGARCKHMLATLYAIDRSCAERGLAPTSLDVTDVDDDALADIGDLRRVSRAPKSRSPVRVATPKPRQAPSVSAIGGALGPPRRRPEPATSWRERVEGYWPKSFQPPAGKCVEVEYVLQAQKLAPAAPGPFGFPVNAGRGAFQVVVAAVTRFGDGSIRRKFGVDRGRDIEDVDRDLLDRIFDTRTLDMYGSSAQPFVTPVGGAAVGCQLAAARISEDLPKLAATGRFGWVPSGNQLAGELVPLAWDGDGVWRLALVMTGRGPVKIRGELVRGDERTALGMLEAVVGDQVAIIDRRIAQVGTSALARWWQLLAAGLELPIGELGAFLDLTCQHADGPILELGDTGWQLSEPALTARTILTPRGQGFGATTELRYGKEVASGGGVLLIDERKREIVRRRFAEERALTRVAKQIGAPVERENFVAGTKVRAVVEAATAAGMEVWVAGKVMRRSAELSASVSSGIDWFDVTIEVADGDATAGVPELLAALRKDQPFLRLSDGSVVLRPKWLDTHSRLIEHAAREDGSALRFRRAEALVVDQLIGGADQLDVDAGFSALRDRLDRVSELAPRSPRRGFRAELRDYQRHGLGWLHFLREAGFGGCLADDMGLGKTVQVLALLDSIRPKAGEKRRPSLVVAPRSLVFHWLDEARRFAPQLTTLEWHGAAREQAAKRLTEVDLVVTTYATLRRDVERFAQQRFELVVLDEAQAIKSAKSQIAAACRELRADHRLALTGTPIENRLDDLASIFEFLNPGLLGRASILRDLGAAAGELEQARVLGKLLRPFLLRRTKNEVLTELPPKTEHVLTCRLEGKERKRYDELRCHYRDALLPQIERDGVGRSAIVVLEALLRLRQAALHPGLLDPERGDEPSAKLDALVEQLREVTGSGHRALVFSQFTSLLAIVQRRLEREAIAFEYLDGQTADRRERVEAFQTGNAPVFLLSLKAGGTGLNLTRADHVFLLDPWWNPAVEAQAIDRVHRIGQDRPVTAYRLVAEDTVEAKILALQDHKRALFSNLFEDKGVLARMTADDIKVLLE